MYTHGLKPFFWVAAFFSLGLTACSHETPSASAPEPTREVHAQVVTAQAATLPEVFPVAGVLEACLLYTSPSPRD